MDKIEIEKIGLESFMLGENAAYITATARVDVKIHAAPCFAERHTYDIIQILHSIHFHDFLQLQRYISFIKMAYITAFMA
jgi:hypothetical protein